MSDVVSKLWNYCNTLRHDGMNYGDYIEQLTYLLFLKLADENKVAVPKGCNWGTLKLKNESELLEYYSGLLQKLAKGEGLLKEIFRGSVSRFRDSSNLKKLIGLIDETNWAELTVDLKANAYEGLLQKYAVEQKGAGQYFTPREAIRSIIRCVRPDVRTDPDFTIHDPACGTAGFLIEAFDWITHESDYRLQLKEEDIHKLRTKTFSGVEIVLETRRLALMNLFLHGIKAEIFYDDALTDGIFAQRRYNCVLTNPPFGIKGAGQTPNRSDFTIRTSNKQLNFIQHVLTVLKENGEAAIVLPDNVLFGNHAGREIRRLLLSNCNLHTILRLPIGMFMPYSAGVKANVLFIKKEKPTVEIWIYDLRTSLEKISKSNRLTDEYFKEFELCYNAKPRHETSRFRWFSVEEIERANYDLSSIWLDAQSDKSEYYSNPEDLLSDAISDMEQVMNSLSELLLMLSDSHS